MRERESNGVCGLSQPGCSLRLRVGDWGKLKAALSKLKKFAAFIQHLVNLWELVP